MDFFVYLMTKISLFKRIFLYDKTFTYYIHLIMK